MEKAIAKFKLHAIAHPNSGKGDRNVIPSGVRPTYPISGKKGKGDHL
ncbi:hypothetical protein ACOWPH_28480 (plasmid) [Anabaena sp. PCC 7938]|nr:hypothetical protein [Anabaena sp. CCAP 1446/1C]MCM2405974.1 hypothetical protein [Anabaena sp. CCAP 1446/1C]